MTRVFLYEALSAGALGDAGPPELLAAGRSMRDAVAGDLARIAGVAVTVAVSQQEAGHAGHAGRAAARTGESAEAFVRRQARQHDLCWVIAPETGGLLARLHEAVGEDRWIGCNRRAILLASSKRATCALLHRAGLLTPQAFAGAHRGRWIVKPDDGAGTTDTRLHATREAAQADVHRRALAGRRAVAEGFVEGEPLSISLLAGPELARPVAFNRQRLQVDAAGWLHDLGVQAAAVDAYGPRAAALHALALDVAAALPGLGGFVGIDVVWNEGEGPVVIEVNPRVTCAYVGLSALAGRNLANDILRLHRGQGLREAAVHGAA